MLWCMKFMRFPVWAIKGLVAATIGAVLIVGEPAYGNEIWLGAIDPVSGANRAPHMDFLDLIRPDAPWQNAASKVKVMKVITQFIGGASDELLTATFADLKRRGIALAVEGLMLSGDFKCGQGVEGFVAPGQMAALAARIRRLGGNLGYIAMDEPLWYGHHFSGPTACHFSISDLARIVAQNVAGVRKSFPNVQIGDIEPVAAPEPTDWTEEVMEWARAYGAATGKPLAFFQADVQWREKWEPQLATLHNRLRAAGIQFGIVYNGNPSDTTGVEWTRHAEERFVAVERDPAQIPDQAILQTWDRHPLHMLPETQPGTMTNLVLRYVARETRLNLQQNGASVTGRLTDAAGQPVANAQLELTGIGADQARVSTTNSQGDFTFPLTGAGTTPKFRCRVDFAGSQGYRLTSATLP